MIPDKIPEFLDTRTRLFGIPTLPESDFLLSDLFDTRLFATRSTTTTAACAALVIIQDHSSDCHGKTVGSIIYQYIT